jgi:hypothetical protein
MLSPENDIKNYTWKDKEYYKLYQRELYQRRLGVKCICENCGRRTTNRNLKKHQATMKRINAIKPGERVERAEQFEKMLINLSINSDREKNVSIATE